MDKFYAKFSELLASKEVVNTNQFIKSNPDIKRTTLHDWREGSKASVVFVEKCFNALGYTLVPTPMNNTEQQYLVTKNEYDLIQAYRKLSDNVKSYIHGALKIPYYNPCGRENPRF